MMFVLSVESVRSVCTMNMVVNLVVSLMCLALCHCTMFRKDSSNREVRSITFGHAGANGFSDEVIGSSIEAIAPMTNDAAGPFSSAGANNEDTYNENVLRQAMAYAEMYGNQYGSPNPETPSQNLPYYNDPDAGTIVSYEQAYEVPKQYAENKVVSSSIYNGHSNSDITAAKNQDLDHGLANGIASYGLTSSNANSFGSGSSNANNIHETEITATKTQGFGSANSQSDGGVNSASSLNSLNFNSANANTQGFGSSPNAMYNSVNPGNVDNNKSRKKNGWLLATSYNIPSSSRGQAASQSLGGSSKSKTYANRFGNVQSPAQTQGHASASSHSGNGNRYANSPSSSNGFGSAKSNNNINDYGRNSHSSSSGLGNAQSSANQEPNYQVRPTFVYPLGGSANAQAAGLGPASTVDRTQGTSYRESKSNSYGSGGSQAFS